jgi:hypothetical protein
MLGLGTSVNRGGFVSADPLLLDTYSGAAAAYSLRKLSSSYSGNCVTVRRDSDNLDANIGFSGGVLDTSALASHCGSANGFVATWFDQSGNSRNATQLTATNQPKIYDGTTGVVTEDGKPAIEFIPASSTDLSSGGSLSIGTIFTVTKTSASGRSTIVGGAGNVFLRTDGTVIDISAVSPLELSGQTIGSYNLIYGLYNGVNSELGNRGGTVATGDAGNGSYADFHIGSKNNSNFALGTMQEIIIYSSDQSSNRTGIESNINTFYSIF